MERVTLDAYLAAPVESRRSPEEVAAWVSSRKPKLEALTKPGDEWWRWISGTQPLMQWGGLALVRHGVVVWARFDWIS